MKKNKCSHRGGKYPGILEAEGTFSKPSDLASLVCCAGKKAELTLREGAC